MLPCDRKRRKPPRQAQTLCHGLDDLEHDSRSQQIDAQHLPERAPVDFVDQPLET